MYDYDNYSQYAYDIIPSRTMREYLKSIDHRFTDEERFLIICNNETMTHSQKLNAISEIAAETDKEALYTRAQSRFDYECAIFNKFTDNVENSCVYLIFDNKDNFWGAFKNWESAKHHIFAFTEKRKVKLEMRKYLLNSGTEVGNVEANYGYCDFSEATAYFNEKGELMKLDSNEDVDCEPDFLTENGFVNMPYPDSFSVGVRVIYKGKVGAIAISREELEKCWEAARDYAGDWEPEWNDMELLVRFREGDREVMRHIHPMYLELAREVERYNRLNYGFVHSDTVREHLIEQNYTFSEKERLTMIMNDGLMLWENKINLLEEISEATAHYDHKMLIKRRVSFEQKALEMFKDNSDGQYVYSVTSCDGEDWGIFESYDDAFLAARGCGFGVDFILGAVIEKINLGLDCDEDCCDCIPENVKLSVRGGMISQFESCKYIPSYAEDFDEFCDDFVFIPYPFQEGDHVRIPFRNLTDNVDGAQYPDLSLCDMGIVGKIDINYNGKNSYSDMRIPVRFATGIKMKTYMINPVYLER